jgi:2Fe-2S ferredoxin
MTKITYVEHDGKEHTVDVENGLSVMEGAVKNLIPGIDADCGGACACATCMVYVGPEWAEKLPAVDSQEETMLSFSDHATPESRLSCQLKVSEALEGLRVRMPKSQH